MGSFSQYRAEYALISATMIVGVLGFWDIYLGDGADPQPHHHLHVATTYLWMGLLLAQVIYLSRGMWLLHRRMGLIVLVAGPSVVASAAMLTVHSASRAIASGQDDFLIVQNIVGTIWLALLLTLAFAMKKRRKVHGALLASTLILFLGPALFFALITFAPPFRIEGPETFYRFQTASWTGLGIILTVTIVMFARNRRSNWPYLLAAGSYLVSEGIKPILNQFDLTDPLTRLVATPSQSLTFVLSFLAVATILAAFLFPPRALMQVQHLGDPAP